MRCRRSEFDSDTFFLALLRRSELFVTPHVPALWTLLTYSHRLQRLGGFATVTPIEDLSLFLPPSLSLPSLSFVCLSHAHIWRARATVRLGFRL